jgi:dTDP-4-dehydrorhamnose reductase
MRVLVTGASGQLGGYLLRELAKQKTPVVAWSGSSSGQRFDMPLQPVELANPDQLAAAFRAARPTLVLHTAALSTVAVCWREPERAQQINTQASAQLAELALEAKARLLLVSTDLVFDGERGGYREEDSPVPLSVYGRTKAAAEPAVLALPRGIVVRVSLLYGPTVVGRPSFFDEQIAALREHRPITLFADEWRTPLSFATAARALLAIVRSDVHGLLHLGGPERMSRVDMGQRLAAYLGADPSCIVAVSRTSMTSGEPRPRDTSLDSARWRALFPSQPWPRWEEALAAESL